MVALCDLRISQVTRSARVQYICIHNVIALGEGVGCKYAVLGHFCIHPDFWHKQYFCLEFGIRFNEMTSLHLYDKFWYLNPFHIYDCHHLI